MKNIESTQANENETTLDAEQFRAFASSELQFQMSANVHRVRNGYTFVNERRHRSREEIIEHYLGIANAHWEPDEEDDMEAIVNEAFDAVHVPGRQSQMSHLGYLDIVFLDQNREPYPENRSE